MMLKDRVEYREAMYKMVAPFTHLRMHSHPRIVQDMMPCTMPVRVFALETFIFSYIKASYREILRGINKVEYTSPMYPRVEEFTAMCADLLEWSQVHAPPAQLGEVNAFYLDLIRDYAFMLDMNGHAMAQIRDGVHALLKRLPRSEHD